MSTALIPFLAENCQSCGLVFKLPKHFIQHRRDTGGSFFCPGCKDRWTYTKTENARLREELEKERKRVAYEIEQKRMERCDRFAAERREKLAKTKLRKLTERTQAGLCPYCNRSFKQLKAHLNSKHKKEREKCATKS